LEGKKDWRNTFYSYSVIDHIWLLRLTYRHLWGLSQSECIIFLKMSKICV